MEEDVTLDKLLEVKYRKLEAVYLAFSSVMAGGFDYSDAMKKTLSELSKIWELLGYIFDLASSDVELELDFEEDKWICLERIETNIRKCLLIENQSIESASFLLMVLGVILSDSEKSLELWK